MKTRSLGILGFLTGLSLLGGAACATGASDLGEGGGGGQDAGFSGFGGTGGGVDGGGATGGTSGFGGTAGSGGSSAGGMGGTSGAGGVATGGTGGVGGVATGGTTSGGTGGTATGGTGGTATGGTGGTATGGTGGTATGGTGGTGGGNIIPTTCAQARGTVGCCGPNNEIYWWECGTLLGGPGSCQGSPCGWDPTNNWYSCGGTGFTGSDPTGTYPRECGGTAPPPAGSCPGTPCCQGYCGSSSPAGCWCDLTCTIAGDCCPDACATCGAC